MVMLVATVTFAVAVTTAFYFWQSRYRMSVWKQVHHQYGEKFPELLPDTPLGAGNGSIGDQRFLYLAVNAVRSGVCIQKLMPPFNVLYRPIYVPWNALTRIIVKPKARTMIRGREHHVNAALFLWGAECSSIEIPWRTEFEAVVPSSVIVENRLTGG